MTKDWFNYDMNCSLCLFGTVEFWKLAIQYIVGRNIENEFFSERTG